MKTILLVRSTAALAAIVLTRTAGAQTWTTVDDFVYASGQQVTATALGADTAGNTYAAGWGGDAAGIPHALVMKSADAGNTWSTIQDFNYASGADSFFEGFGVDAGGNLYAVGMGWTNSVSRRSTVTTGHWIVRRSADKGATWATVDDFSLALGRMAWALNFTTDSAGNLYVAGAANDGTAIRWIVRKSIDGGSTWFTADNFSYGANTTWGRGIVSTPDGLFVAGFGDTLVVTSSKPKLTVESYHWLVRKSVDGGASWATVDDFQYSPGNGTAAYGITADTAGGLYVVGQSGVYSSGTTPRWLVRKSANAGASWATVDDFQSGGTNSVARGAVVDALGNVCVIGQGREASGGYDWIVRKSDASGPAWSTVDDFSLAHGHASNGAALGIDASGSLYSAGFGQDSSSIQHWLVRKLSP